MDIHVQLHIKHAYIHWLHWLHEQPHTILREELCPLAWSPCHTLFRLHIVVCLATLLQHPKDMYQTLFVGLAVHMVALVRREVQPELLVHLVCRSCQ